jgi:hypothetical protein
MKSPLFLLSKARQALLKLLTCTRAESFLIVLMIIGTSKVYAQTAPLFQYRNGKNIKTAKHLIEIQQGMIANEEDSVKKINQKLKNNKRQVRKLESKIADINKTINDLASQENKKDTVARLQEEVAKQKLKKDSIDKKIAYFKENKIRRQNTIRQLQSFLDSCMNIMGLENAQIANVGKKIEYFARKRQELLHTIANRKPEEDVSAAIKEVDSLEVQIGKLWIQQEKYATMAQLNQGKLFCPLLNKYDYDTLHYFLFGQSKVGAFQNLNIRLGKTAFVNTEFFDTYFGPVRAAISGQYAPTEDSTTDAEMAKNIQSLITNGGAVSLSFIAPTLYAQSVNASTAHFLFYFSLRNGLGSINQKLNDMTFNQQAGFSLYGDWNSDNNAMGVSVEIPCYYSWGTPSLYKQFDVTDFSLVQIKVGLRVKGLVSLYVSGPLWSSTASILKTPFAATIQASPSQIAEALSK